MEYTKLGRTGLEVSRLCLGCMTYGVPERGSHPWTINEEQSRPFIRKALDLGINTLASLALPRRHTDDRMGER